MLTGSESKFRQRGTIDISNRTVFQHLSPMTWLLSGKMNRFFWVVAASIGTVGWCSLVEAAPQLRYRTVQIGGTTQTCLARAGASMAAAGFTNPATTDSEVIGTNGQIAATVACQALSPSNFRQRLWWPLQRPLPRQWCPLLWILSRPVLPAEGAAPIPPVSPTGQQAMGAEGFNQLMAALEDSWPDYLEFLAQPVFSELLHRRAGQSYR